MARVSQTPVATLDAVSARKTRTFPSLTSHARWSLVIFVASAVSIGGLLSQTDIAGAVVGNGVLVVEGGAKTVQHPAGGVVSSLLVSEGDNVKAGEPVIRLDDTSTRAQFNTTAVNLAQQEARLARLLAERDGLSDIDFSRVFRDRDVPADEYESIFMSERTQFRLRREDRNGQRQQLAERIAQSEQEIVGQMAQLIAVQKDTTVVRKQGTKLKTLLEKRLISGDRMYELERTLAQLEGTQGELQAAIASNQGRISEFKLSIISIDQTLRSQVTDQLANTQMEISQLKDRLTVSRQAMAQAVIVAPQSGRVLDLKVHTVGGVISAGQPLMTIVPQDEPLVGEIRVNPADVDQLAPGQAATLQFTAFDRATTPGLNARLKFISADLIQDPRSGTMYYLARVSALPAELGRLGRLKLIAGMPVQVFIQTSHRSILSYLIKPLLDQMNLAFRG